MKRQPQYNKGDKIGNRYQVYKALMGGMGEVYLCLELTTVQPFALKTFQRRFLAKPHLLRNIFEQEVATWVALEKHPNIVRCFYMQTLDNQPFMILEWIADEGRGGADLRTRLRHGALDPQLAMEIVIDVCRGLLYAQEKQPGLVHRDLKPENILIAQGNLAKITDFGLAQIVQTSEFGLETSNATFDGRHTLLSHKGIAGTPTYMAPEQWRGEALDERTDVYALGCILYEMLNGQPAYKAKFRPTNIQEQRRWLRELQTAHESDGPPSFSALVSATVAELVHFCLAKSITARPTLVEFFDALTDCYQNQFGQPPPERPLPGVFTAVDYTNRAFTYDALQEYEAALADANRAIDIDSNYVQAYLSRGNIYKALQQYEKALADFACAIELDPKYIHAYISRGVIYADRQEYQTALVEYTCAIDIDPTFALAYSNRGVAYHALKKYKSALADCAYAIDLDPNYAQAYFNRGTIYHDLHQFQAALTDYNQAIELDPQHAQAFSNRGVIYADLQQYQAALADHNQAIELDPNYAQAYSNRGLTYHELQEYEPALTDLNRAIELDSSFAQAYFNRGNTYLALQQGLVALEDFNRAIDIDPNYAEAYANRGNTYRTLQQYEAALVDFTRAIELDPNDATFYYNRGTTYADLRQDQKALTDYTSALELDPNFAQAHFNLGVLLGNQGKFDKALPYFEKASQLGHPQGAQYLALARRMRVQ